VTSSSSEFRLCEGPAAVSDPELVALLRRAYVDGGFTTPERALTVFAPAAVRQRGHMILARGREDHALAGMVVVVPPSSHARRLAGPDEAELHLLAVDPAYRGRGVGRALILAALESIHRQGFRKTVLWTQPSMVGAQRLYEGLGFVRNASRDPNFDGIRFLAYEVYQSASTTNSARSPAPP